MPVQKVVYGDYNVSSVLGSEDTRASIRLMCRTSSVLGYYQALPITSFLTLCAGTEVAGACLQEQGSGSHSVQREVLQEPLRLHSNYHRQE